ncbi:MAG: homocysteine S-methyltransferase family protein [Candidatus Hinthialibacter antarcticus]|nr:homocysteine S-methyltransferase family protein [Candidatus Hinthialibacter antarcticus]
MNELFAQLLAKGPVVTDGAWGTQMQARGLNIGEAPDLWNLSHPDKVEEVARAYVEAGSNIILTNTFGASRVRLSDHELADKAIDINREGAAISKRAAQDKAKVFASIGPSGKLLMMGQTSEEELLASFEEQANALAAGGADAIVIETMSDPNEARIAVAAAKQTGLPVVACMVFDTGKNKDRTMMGTTPEEAAELMCKSGADAIGSNCGQGIEGFIDICRRMKSACDKPIWIKANAGLPKLVNGEAVYTTTPQEFAQRIGALVEVGASFIGGCCGTTPEFIRAVCDTLE